MHREELAGGGAVFTEQERGIECHVVLADPPPRTVACLDLGGVFRVDVDEVALPGCGDRELQVFAAHGFLGFGQLDIAGHRAVAAAYEIDATGFGHGDAR